MATSTKATLAIVLERLSPWPSDAPKIAENGSCTASRFRRHGIAPRHGLAADKKWLDGILAVLARRNLPSMLRNFAHQRPELFGSGARVPKHHIHHRVR